ncbi:uncharacterized protein NPIL_18851 [Nephila pilipes]|uniref:Chitin-binding type-2 domain-containing protein n=1 Tax=Nephila pilipes TaxID=299642 RepID=A0A8X6PKM2_NEPPI|nr:uncharacterized protein NPIL_18851 [Nephila pilipes]
MTWIDISSSVSKPQASLHPTPPAPSPRLISRGNVFQFSANSAMQWEAPLPNHYSIRNQQFTFQDACHGQRDGRLVPATGPALYDYLEKDKLVSFPQLSSFEFNALSTLQHKQVYYFSCRQGKIQNLHMCPPGHFFHHTQCQPIDRCVGQPDGMRFSDPYDIHHYHECLQEKAVRHSCPPNTLFLHDQCRDTNDVSLYCQFHTEPKILDPNTLLVCRQGQAVFETCPPGFRYFDSPTCESEACVGQPNHQLVPMPKVQQGPLTYFPGYMQCQDNKVANVVVCPDSWDPYSSAGDNLTHLPQVFDGRSCTIPEFCTNVESDDPLVTVPVHEFTKHVRNWKYSDRFDAVTGIQCQGNKRKRVSMSPGERIHSKRLKPESACDGTVSKVVISNTPEFILIATHRRHPDCTLYPFLSQIPFSVKLKGGSQCTFRSTDRRLVKQLTTLPILYWAQREVEQEPTDEPCESGQHLQTGHFVFDRTIYATCDESQPFVFCPSSDTKCIEKVEGKRWACELPLLPPSSIIPPHSIVIFAAHEVKNLYPTAPPPIRVGINKIFTDVPQTGLCPTSAFQLETLDQSVAVEYAHRVTYPPDVVWNENGGKVSRLGGGYLAKLQDFTKKHINLPMHNIKYVVSDFALNRKP